MTVMIVDDSAEMRCLLRDLVAPVADQVVECADGRECLERFVGFQPDWTIMDVRMPRLDGISATRELHARWPAARVLLITGQTVSPAVVAVADEAGAVGCLSKDDLFRLLDVLKQPGGAALPSSSTAGPN